MIDLCVHEFGKDRTQGSAEMRDLLGGKGANLAEMARLGLPVPPGFTIPTAVSNYYFDNRGAYPKGLEEQVANALVRVGEDVGRSFGSAERPLLLSVRSGARASMPGMMDTILNLGLNDRTVEALARLTDNRRFAYDSYRRFIQMYGDVVLGVERHRFEDILSSVKRARGVAADADLDAAAFEEICVRFKECLRDCGSILPEAPEEQLWGAIGAVFSSWRNPRAIAYRRLNAIPDDWGTAVNVQAMVFGNLGPTSATGVAFTRNPSTGEPGLFGEFLVNAQGEDVVAGIRTPNPIRAEANGASDTLEQTFPACFEQLDAIGRRLEAHYRDMQDLEFTIEEGQLWMLQTRSAKRSATASVRTAIDFVEQGMISREEALTRVQPSAVEQLLHPTLDNKAGVKPAAKGLAGSPGAASGKIVFTSEEAVRSAAEGEDTILVRAETSPEDILGMNAARGILTLCGGLTSHAAVVARGMGRVCVVGASTLRIEGETLLMGDASYAAGDVITISGTTGDIFSGALPLIPAQRSAELDRLLSWADEAADLGVRANADTPEDTRIALENGATGIGLCRTEHMFFQDGRIGRIRQMILAPDEASRKDALSNLLEFQRTDFEAIFDALEGSPVTIRLLDPPLHEFLPREQDLPSLSRELGVTVEDIRSRSEALTEVNPMLGFRGCRLSVIFPEITEMQIRAIVEAALASKKRTGTSPALEIMVPLITNAAEFAFVRTIINKTAEAVFSECGSVVDYKVGTMIELPAAALSAGTIAAEAEFFSFGTNDLTQTTLGLSRDDAGRFLPAYIEKSLLTDDPFVTIDRNSVGILMTLATEEGRKTRPDIKLGICGEHAADLKSVFLCDELELDYVSCSPMRVPVARLAAAQAAIGRRKSKDGSIRAEQPDESQ